MSLLKRIVASLRKNWIGWFIFVGVAGLCVLWFASIEKEPCLIKGNINEQGEHIYHRPEDLYYERTQIDESKGEKWFCTPDEAKSAGWRHSKV